MGFPKNRRVREKLDVSSGKSKEWTPLREKRQDKCFTLKH